MQIQDIFIKYITPEKWVPFFAAEVSLDDIFQLTQNLAVIDSSSNWNIEKDNILYRALWNNNLNLNNFELKDIVYNEQNIIEYLVTYNFINKFYNKITKQLENIYSPYLKYNNINEFSLYMDNIEDNVLLTQNTESKNKFNFMATKTYLENSLNLDDEENIIKYINYIEWTAWFSISRTNLENTLKKKGYLEDQIEEWLKPFVYTQSESITKAYYPNFWNYNPNERIIFQVTDAVFTENNWTTSMDPSTLLELYSYIENVLERSKHLASKINVLLKSDDVKGYRFEYIKFRNESKNKVKMSWLFRDNEWNTIDVVNALINNFKLEEEEVNQFVNSRKRNEIKLLEENNPIFMYEEEKTKFNIILESTKAKRRK